MNRAASERDNSLALVSEISEVTSDVGTFVLTGSYSIDALTNRSISHNDIDANLFVEGLDEETVTETAKTLERHFPAAEKRMQRQDRLEYTIGSRATRELVEIQFIDYIERNDDDFLLRGQNAAGNNIVVPIVRTEIGDSRGDVYEFKVKSLSFAIATWAIRISGLIDYQKRPVRQTDIDHYAILLEQPHDIDDIRQVMAHHPQMIAISPDIILQTAAAKIGDIHG